MSTFLLNHPISHTLVINAILFTAFLIVGVNVIALGEIFRVPRAAWPTSTTSRLRWIAAGFFGVLLLPVAVIVSFGVGHNGMLLMLAGLPSPAIWWLYTRKRLQVNVAGLGLPWPSSKGSERKLFFGAADTKTLKVMRFAIGVLAYIGFSLSFTAVNKWTVGDPTYIDAVGPSGATIHPRPYIVAACPTSVRETLHMIGFVYLSGHNYQRWTVVPFPGHLDEVLLDTDSGKVICP